MPPKKRKGRSAASTSSSASTSTGIISRRNRRSPVTASASASSSSSKNSKFKKTKNKLKDAAAAAAAEAARQRTLEQSASYKMHTITHHASFVPTTSLQHTRLSSGSGGSSVYTHTHAHLGVNGNTGNGHANGIGSVNGNHKAIATTSGMKRSRPYALYHPRNLGLIPPTIIQPPSDATTTSHGHHGHGHHHHHHHKTTNKGKGKGKSNKGNHSSTNYNPLAHGNFNTSHVDMNTPHSAGCRMKYLTQPTFHPLPPSTTNPLEMHHTMSTVMAKGNSNSIHGNGNGGNGTIAIGDSGGFVTIYTSIPSIRTLVRLKTSASERFYNTYANAAAVAAAAATKSKAKRRKSDNEALSSSSSSISGGNANTNANSGTGTGSSANANAGTGTSTSAGSAAISHHLPLHFHSKSIVASSIDKSNAVECLALLRDGVCIGTHMEIEFIEFHNANDHANGIANGNDHDHDNASKRRWIWHGDYGWDDCDGSSNNHDSLEKGKRMIRGHPLRLDANDYYEDTNDANISTGMGTGTKILASFGCFPCPRSKHDNDEMQNQMEIRPELYSPVLMIDAESGALSNVVPRERCQNQMEQKKGNEKINMDTKMDVELDDKKNDVQNDNGTDTMWVNCKLGPRATAIFDKRTRGNIVASFITYRYEGGGNDNGSSDANDGAGAGGELIAKQELMMINSSHQIIHRTTLPTKSNGPKLITVEAINQSPHGDYTISATSKGGVRVYTTDGLLLLGAFGEGVSLHGHSIVWQDIFFVRMDRSDDNMNTHAHLLEQQQNTQQQLQQLDKDGLRSDCTSSSSKTIHSNGHGLSSSDAYMNMSHSPTRSQEQWGQLLERTDELKHREDHAQKRKALSKQKDSLTEMFIVSVPSAFREPVDMKETIHVWDSAELEPYVGLRGLPYHQNGIGSGLASALCKIPGSTLPSFTILAPKKSEGICSFLHDDNLMTSHAGRFLLSTHGGECLQMTPTITTDWAGQMYPAGFLVIDNNLAYIEDEDELDEVVDEWNYAPENTEYCQEIDITSMSNTSPKQNESELELALQMSMMDAHIDVVDSDDNYDMFDVPPCRPEPHLKRLVTSKSEGSDTNVSSNEGTSSLTSLFDLMNTLPNVEAIDDHIKQQEERENRRKTTIAETEQKIIDENGEPIKIPRRKATNIEYIINAAVDKHLTIHMLQRMGLSDGSCMSLKTEGYLPLPSPIVEEHASEEVPTSSDISTDLFCPACRGRSVIHICGKRATPIDYDAIAKAAKEKKELEEAEKKKLQQERRKAAEQRRKEKKQLQKKEERMAEELRQTELRKEEEKKQEQERELEQEQDEEEEEEETDRDRSNSDVTGGASDNADDSSNHHMHSPNMDLHKEQNDQFNSNHPSLSMHHYSPSHYGSGDLPSYPLTSPRQQHNGHNLHSYPPPTSHISSHQEVSFGDSMFSNIPTLPSEPSSFMYQNHYDRNNNNGFPREHDRT